MASEMIICTNSVGIELFNELSRWIKWEVNETGKEMIIDILGEFANEVHNICVFIPYSKIGMYVTPINVVSEYVDAISSLLYQSCMIEFHAFTKALIAHFKLSQSTIDYCKELAFTSLLDSAMIMDNPQKCKHALDLGANPRKCIFVKCLEDGWIDPNISPSIAQIVISKLSLSMQCKYNIMVNIEEYGREILTLPLHNLTRGIFKCYVSHSRKIKGHDIEHYLSLGSWIDDKK